MANDATALVLYRFAVAAVSLGTFSLSEAAGSLVAILAGEMIWGIGVGWLMLRLRRWVRDPKVEIMLSLLTPYAAYWPPEQLGGSGVLATVAAGLYISWNGLRLISAATRLQGVFFWDFLVYLIEGMVFLITGLQARALVSAFTTNSISGLAMAAAVVSAVVIATRFIWVFPAAYLPRLARPGHSPQGSHAAVAMAVCARIHRDPGRRFARGCARNSVHDRGRQPISGPRPDPLPDLLRDLRHPRRRGTGAALGQSRAWSCFRRPPRSGRRSEIEEFRARKRALEAAIGELERLSTERQAPETVVRPIRTAHANRLKLVDARNDGDARHRKLVDLGDEIEFSLIEAERDSINDLYRNGELKDEPRRRIERELDLRDAHLANLRAVD